MNFYLGTGDNEAGLLLLSDSSREPKRGRKSLEWRAYVDAEEVGPDVFHYETS